MRSNRPLLFAGSSHPLLAEEVARLLGSPLGLVQLSSFPDGEIRVEVGESVRGRDLFLLQTVALDPHFYLMEMLIIIDALRRASASSIAAVIPYFGYARQDRKDRPRVPITAKLVANLLVKAGATRVVTVDLHAGQIEGFFDVPVDHLHASASLLESMQKTKVDGVEWKKAVVVAPDIGSIKTAEAVAAHLGAEFAVVDKQRLNASRVVDKAIIGSVAEKDVLLVDDMCSTGATLESAAKACREKGAKRMFGLVTHGLFVGDAIQRIEQSPLELVWVTNTVPLENRLLGATKLRPVSVAPLLSHAIARIVIDGSVSE